MPGLIETLPYGMMTDELTLYEAEYLDRLEMARESKAAEEKRQKRARERLAREESEKAEKERRKCEECAKRDREKQARARQSEREKRAKTAKFYRVGPRPHGIDTAGRPARKDPHGDLSAPGKHGEPL